MTIEKHEGRELYFLLDVSAEELYLLRQALDDAIEKRETTISAKKVLHIDIYQDYLAVEEYSKFIEVIDKTY